MVKLKFLVMVSVLLVVGCATRPAVTTDYDSTYNFAALKAFSIKETKQESKEDLLISPFTLGHVQALIGAELSKKYNLASASIQPDFIVSYHLVMEEKLEANQFNTMYGVGGWGRGYRYPSPFMQRSVFDSPVQVYDQGTLIIDVVDAKNQQPIWRGVSEKRLSRGLSPQKQRDVLTGAVLETLAQFPPVK